MNEEYKDSYFYLNEIEKKKMYLRETDYVVIKMYETVVQGGSILEMLKEYREILSKREEARKKINELEEQAIIRRIKC